MKREIVRAVFWPTVWAALACLLLIGLGTWQLERKAWKEALIQRLVAGAAAEPMVLDAAATLFRSGEELEYRRVRARGRFLNDKSLFLFNAMGAQAGYHVYVPFETPNGPVLMVNRGFMPQELLSSLDLTPNDRGPFEEIVGRLRKPGSKGLFDAGNDVQKNRWYWRDLDGMILAGFPDGKRTAYPFFLEVEPAATIDKGAARYPQPIGAQIQLPNRHLEYAMTWYGFAVTLIVVYFLFIRSRLRDLRPARPARGSP